MRAGKREIKLTFLSINIKLKSNITPIDILQLPMFLSLNNLKSFYVSMFTSFYSVNKETNKPLHREVAWVSSHLS